MTIQTELSREAAIRGADPTGIIRALGAVPAFLWLVGYAIEWLLKSYYPDAVSSVMAWVWIFLIVLAVICFGSRMTLRRREMKWWSVQSLSSSPRPDLTLPLTLGKNPLMLRSQRALGWFLLLIALLFTAMFLVMPLGPAHGWPSLSHIAGKAGLLFAAFGCYAVALTCLLRENEQITLTEHALIVGGQTIPITAETDCSFRDPALLHPLPWIDIRTGSESVSICPQMYYHATPAVAGEGDGARLLQALATRCGRGNARAWLIAAFPSLPATYPASNAESARLHPITIAALGVLGLLVTALVLLMLVAPVRH